MNKTITIIVILIFSFFTNISIAGEDGKTKINDKKKNGNIEVNDCFESLNRGVFAFNQGLDKVVFKPLARL